MEEESESTTGPNLFDLPRELTTKIPLRLGTFEILTTACLVCTQWLKICKDPLMWRTLHIPKYMGVNSWEMGKICYNVVKLSCGHLEQSIIDYCYGTDDLLKCIVDNGSQLRCMRLVNCLVSSDKGFSEAVRKLPQLEKVDISHCHLTKVSLEALGRSCPLLKLLKFVKLRSASCNSDKMAFAIAETMPGLRHLDMKGHKLTQFGVLAIIDKCPLLESLDIRDCHYLNEDLEKKCIEKVKDLQLPVCDNYDVDYYNDEEERIFIIDSERGGLSDGDDEKLGYYYIV